MIIKDIRILIIEDDFLYTQWFQQKLTKPEFNLEFVRTFSQAFDNVVQNKYDIVLLDLDLSGNTELVPISTIKTCSPDLPIIILTSLDDEQVAEKAIQAGAQDYLVKRMILLQGEDGKGSLIRSIRHSIERQQIQAALLRELNTLESGVAQRTVELQKANEFLNRSNERLKILHEFQCTAITLRSCIEISQVAIQTCAKLVPLTWAEILISNPVSQKFEVTAQTQVDEAQLDEDSLPISSIFPTRILRKEKNIYVDDLRLGENPSLYEKRLIHKGIISYILFSLVVEGNIIGVICLGADKPRGFNEENFEDLQVFSVLLALTIHNARLFEQLNSTSERLHSLAAQLVSAQEDERRRISLELHDEAGQALTAIKLNLALLQQSLPENTSNFTVKVNEAMRMTDETMDLIRSLAHGLHPPALDAVGLNQAFSDYCQRATRQSGIKIHYTGKEIPQIPDHIKISLYRVLQEALNNVFKHAHASYIEVSLGVEKDSVTLFIHDNGQGFSQSPSVVMTRGIGLKGIHNRIEALGGNIKIISSHSKGTSLIAKIPWKVTE